MFYSIPHKPEIANTFLFLMCSAHRCTADSAADQQLLSCCLFSHLQLFLCLFIIFSLIRMEMD